MHELVMQMGIETGSAFAAPSGGFELRGPISHVTCNVTYKLSNLIASYPLTPSYRRGRVTAPLPRTRANISRAWSSHLTGWVGWERKNEDSNSKSSDFETCSFNNWWRPDFGGPGNCSNGRRNQLSNKRMASIARTSVTPIALTELKLV